MKLWRDSSHCCRDFSSYACWKNDERNRDKFCFMSDAWVEAKFRVCYLTEQHRQGNDYLNDILNAIRAQAISPEHRSALQATSAGYWRYPSLYPQYGCRQH